MRQKESCYCKSNGKLTESYIELFYSIKAIYTACLNHPFIQALLLMAKRFLSNIHTPTVTSESTLGFSILPKDTIANRNKITTFLLVIDLLYFLNHKRRSCYQGRETKKKAAGFDLPCSKIWIAARQ